MRDHRPGALLPMASRHRRRKPLRWQKAGLYQAPCSQPPSNWEVLQFCPHDGSEVDTAASFLLPPGQVRKVLGRSGAPESKEALTVETSNTNEDLSQLLRA